VKYFLAICLIVLTVHAKAQSDSGFVLLRSFEGDIADVVMDNLDNLYVISSSGQVRKYNSNGDSAAIYNQVRNFGKLHAIDVSNPLRPVLFYRDFSTVVILDRFLSQRNVIDLRKFNIYQPSAVALSYDNNIWVFDEFDNKLKKIDEQGNLMMSTADFRMLFNEDLRPARIINESGLVYLADTTRGIVVFDNYGSFKRKIPVVNWKALTIKDNTIIYTNTGAINYYNISNFMEGKRTLPSNFLPYARAFLSSTRLVNFQNGILRIYQYN
jgi:hypothetical protein